MISMLSNTTSLFQGTRLHGVEQQGKSRAASWPSGFQRDSAADAAASVVVLEIILSLLSLRF